MEPYTSEGMARREALSKEQENQILAPDDCCSQMELSSSPGSSLASPQPMTVSIPQSNQINYELVGVVVHSGQANAGHYYSFIKDRR